MRAVDFDQIFSSDLVRAQTTSKIVFGEDFPIQLRPEFRERALGEFEGLNWTEADARYPKGVESYRHDPEFQIPGGESLKEFFKRVSDSVEALADACPGQRVALVTHGGVLSCLFRKVVGLPLETHRAFKIPNVALNVVQRSPKGWSLETWGDVSHFPIP